MASDGKGQEWERLRDEFARWSATPVRLRKLHGLPVTETDWAELKGTSTRTLRRWKEREDMQQAIALHQSRLEAGLDGGSLVPAVMPRAKTRGEPDPPERYGRAVTLDDDESYETGMSRHELLYRQARDDIFQKASEGSTAAVELMMKYWGTELRDREQAEQDAFREMSDEELVGELVRLAGEELVARTLAQSATL